jgi:hypothetical protein
MGFIKSIKNETKKAGNDIKHITETPVSHVTDNITKPIAQAFTPAEKPFIVPTPQVFKPVQQNFIAPIQAKIIAPIQGATNTAITQINTTSKVIIPTIKSESGKLYTHVAESYIEAKAATISAIKAVDNIPVAEPSRSKIQHGLPGDSSENNYSILMVAAVALAGLLFISQQ